MKVIAFNGSPKKNGNTGVLLNQILECASSNGFETKNFHLNQLKISGCQGCMHCKSNESCLIEDDMQSLYQEIESADAVIIGSPIYMFQVTGQTKIFMDRLFPFIDCNDFTSRISKKTILAISQGMQDVEAFKSSIKITADCLNLLGLKVVETIVVTEGNTISNEQIVEAWKKIMPQA